MPCSSALGSSRGEALKADDVTNHVEHKVERHRVVGAHSHQRSRGELESPGRVKVRRRSHHPSSGGGSDVRSTSEASNSSGGASDVSLAPDASSPACTPMNQAQATNHLKSSMIWEPGEPVPPGSSLPIRVQIAARMLSINAIDNTNESFTARFSLHLRWTDRYYQLPRAAEGEGLFVQDGQVVSKKQIVHYASHPRIGRRAVRFPDEDLSMHGLPVPCEGEFGCEPRWTPEFKLFNWTDPPSLGRIDYQADRETGHVTCYYEAQGNFKERLELQRFPFDRQARRGPGPSAPTPTSINARSHLHRYTVPPAERDTPGSCSP